MKIKENKQSYITTLKQIEEMNVPLIAEKPYKSIQLGTESIKKILQALTPPTSDEVCKALSEYLGNQVQYDKRHNLFEMYLGDNIWKPIELLRLREHATHLITLIGRFYEGLEQ